MAKLNSESDRRNRGAFTVDLSQEFETGKTRQETTVYLTRLAVSSLLAVDRSRQ